MVGPVLGTSGHFVSLTWSRAQLRRDHELKECYTLDAILILSLKYIDIH